MFWILKIGGGEGKGIVHQKIQKLDEMVEIIDVNRKKIMVVIFFVKKMKAIAFLICNFQGIC